MIKYVKFSSRKTHITLKCTKSQEVKHPCYIFQSWPNSSLNIPTSIVKKQFIRCYKKKQSFFFTICIVVFKKVSSVTKIYLILFLLNLIGPKRWNDRCPCTAVACCSFNIPGSFWASWKMLDGCVGIGPQVLFSFDEDYEWESTYFRGTRISTSQFVISRAIAIMEWGWPWETFPRSWYYCHYYFNL